MPRFEYELKVTEVKRGTIQIDAPTEGEAYQKLMNNLDSYEEDIYDFATQSIDVEVDTYTIIEEE